MSLYSKLDKCQRINLYILELTIAFIKRNYSVPSYFCVLFLILSLSMH